MQTSYFQGKDGYIWWNGVVEDRKDPLMLGRCKVRILGWHTSDKTELPTDMLPWAQVIMPITSASQTGVGQAPVGPVEGTWVMGFYRDGELAQEPVMTGTLPGIPEEYAKQNTGFYDSRLDTVDRDLQSQKEDGSAGGASKKSLLGFPYPPKAIETQAGSEAVIHEFTDPERKAFSSQSLYPRELNKPTTPIYARGIDDKSTEVDTRFLSKDDDFSGEVSGVSSIIASKLKTKSKNVKVSSTFTPNDVISLKRNGNLLLSSEDQAEIDSVDSEYSISQPPTAYAAVYPFNHVYESESGHLIEVDDTPTKERLHWYHRSGTFTEFHPKGMRVDKTNAHRFNIVTGDYKSIIRGDDIKAVSGDTALNTGKFHLGASKEIRLLSDQNITMNTPSNAYLGGKNITIAATDTLILKGGGKIVREDDTAQDTVKGNFVLDVEGGYKIGAGKLSMGSLGSTSINSFGPMTQTITGNSEETIANSDIIFGNLNAKKITALLGKIVLECMEPAVTGGIDLNLGPFGALGAIQILPGGLIVLRSSAGTVSVIGTAGVSLTSAGPASLVGATATTVGSSATPLTAVDGAFVTVGGSSSPALLATEFLKLFAEHYHPSSVGPTGPLHPSFASKIANTMSKKVFLS
tara:strand:+ start:1793 stop:3691 length:1899 start_codon:yes stop_codon:yes gene_type:complete